jgi:hypothetical protein
MAYEPKAETDGGLNAVNLPSFLRQRRTADVPEDVEDPYMAHFNDPNWDVDHHDDFSETSSVTDVEMGRRVGDKYSTEKFGRPESVEGKSIDQTDVSTTQFDSSSQTESTAVAEQDYNE